MSVSPTTGDRSRANPPSLTAADRWGDLDLATLGRIQDRVLWLATRVIHEANRPRADGDKTKVGGHQASCASMVSILTALYFAFLRAGDRVSIKPHAAPVFHAVQYLLGRLEADQLKTLRRFGGLQAYPSRTKDPDPVDFSTGSVGLGAAAPAFAALVDRYARHHFAPPPGTQGEPPRRRFVATMGDAELDEGNTWEAVTEDHLHALGNVIWIVDLNRQSLDRVVPGVRAAQLAAIFRASRWNVIEVKYGRRLEAAFAGAGGQALRQRIDDMSNQEYQAAIRLTGPECRRRLLAGVAERAELERALALVSDADLPGLMADLGGHDLGKLLDALAQADATRDRPTVIFAYTIKGWGLPTAGHPMNHSALLSDQQILDLRTRLGAPEADEWAGFAAGTPEEALCRAAAGRLAEAEAPAAPPLTMEDIPAALAGHVPLPQASTQETLGRLLFELAETPRVGRRIVTVAPDVAVSTNLGGWINKVGVYSASPAEDYEPAHSAVRWVPNPRGQHLELGISEMNMFLLLGQLGLSQETIGQVLLPVGTVYDPFVLRGLDAFIYGLYNESKFIVAGTPSGISLAPEGGAHQSTVTPGLGIGLPNLISYEPTFARELEWILLAGLRQLLDRRHGRAMYLRLSTRPVEQALLEPALRRLGQDELRRQVLEGGYRLVDAAADLPAGSVDPAETVQIVAAGAIVPEAVAAAALLHEEGVAANVLAVTSADLLYSQLATVRHEQPAAAGQGLARQHLGTLIPPAERAAPMVTVMDGASHTLTFLGAAFGVPVVPLGVDQFGQSGSRADLYRHYGIDAPAIVAAAFQALDLRS